MDVTVLDRIASFSKTQPEKDAIRFKDKAITYGELLKKAKGFAEYLYKNGIKEGDHVIIKASFSFSYWIAFFGVQLALGVAVPVEKDCTVESISEISARVGGAFAIISKEEERENYASSCRLFIDYTLPESLGEKHYIAEKARPMPAPNAIGQILFTTGTTGKAKGVMIKHEYMSHAAISAEDIPYSLDSIIVIPAPPNHVLCIGRTTACLYHGGTAINMDGLSDLAEFYRALSEYKANALVLTPSALNFITTLTGAEFKKYDSQIRFIESGGEKMLFHQQETFKALLPNVRIFIMYASTETGSAAYYEFTKYGPTENRIGKVVRDSTITFTDDDGKVVEATKDSPGRITVGGRYLMTGYVGDKQATDSVLKDGFIQMSDLGYLDEEGFVCLTGRAGDVIISGGQKINPVDVENVAMSTDLLKECVCIGRPDPIFGKLLVLLVVMKEGVAFDAFAIKKHLVNKLESFKVPKFIEQVDAINRNKNGKIDRKSYLS